MKTKKKLRLRLNMSHDSVYIDFDDFRCVFKEHGITCVYVSSAVRQPYQDAIGIILKVIDYHNEQARKDFGNSEFHSKQATVLKLWMIDMKEFITKHEKKESLSIQEQGEEDENTKD